MKQPLYFWELVVRSACILPSPDPNYGISLNMLLFKTSLDTDCILCCSDSSKMLLHPSHTVIDIVRGIQIVTSILLVKNVKSWLRKAKREIELQYIGTFLFLNFFSCEPW